MKVFTLISLVFLSSFIFGCASENKKSLLEERAGYGNNNLPAVNISGGVGAVHYMPSRIPEKVMIAWLHAKELPSKDYFWGSWLSIIVAPEGWEMKKVDVSNGNKYRTQQLLGRPPVKLPPKLDQTRPKT